MSRKGMNGLYTDCATALLQDAEERIRDVLPSISVEFSVAVEEDGAIRMLANVIDPKREDPEMIFYCLGDMGVSSAVICDGDPIDPREFLQ